MPPEEESNKPNPEDLAAELAALKAQANAAEERAKAAETSSAAAQEYMEGIKKAATGETNAPKPRAPHELFVDDILTKGDVPIRQLVSEEMQKRAYFDSLASSFKKENPDLEPLQEEIFGMTNQLVQNGAARGQAVTYETALKNATEHYKSKTKNMLKIAGANGSPYGGAPNMPQSRYAGSEVDYFAMTDDEFKKQVMDPRDNQRKARARDSVAFYGSGR